MRPVHVFIQPAAGEKSFPVSFESVFDALDRFDRLHAEPDGVFVWSGDGAHSPWQLDGLLVDHAGQLRYIELKGAAPIEAHQQLWRLLGWPHTVLSFQLAREGLVLDEQSFRLHLAGRR